MSHTPPTEVTDVLGRTLPVKHTWPDGSWECPHCGYGYSPDRGPCKGRAQGYRTDCGDGLHCQDPACFANPHFPAEEARKRLAEAERRRAEEQARQRNAEQALKRAEQERDARAQKLAEVRVEAEQRGACVRCALKDAPWRVKYVKHRAKCPLEGRR